MNTKQLNYIHSEINRLKKPIVSNNIVRAREYCKYVKDTCDFYQTQEQEPTDNKIIESITKMNLLLQTVKDEISSLTLIDLETFSADYAELGLTGEV